MYVGLFFVLLHGAIQNSYLADSGECCHGWLTLLCLLAYDQNGAGEFTLPWKVTNFDTDLAQSPVFFFWILTEGQGNIPSIYFNITSSNENAQSSSTGTASAPVTTTTGNIEAPDVASNSTIAPASTSSPPLKDHYVLQIGVGVGVGTGLFLALLIAACFWIARIKRRRKAASYDKAQAPSGQAESPSTSSPLIEMSVNEPRYPVETAGSSKPAELGAVARIHELPARGTVYEMQ